MSFNSLLREFDCLFIQYDMKMFYDCRQRDPYTKGFSSNKKYGLDKNRKHILTSASEGVSDP